MPISKRINNLTLTSQSLGEQDTTNASNLQTNVPINQFMAINNQEVQSQHFAQNALANSYLNGGMSHHYLNHGQLTHTPNYHQSAAVPSTNHSTSFHNASHLALGTNAHKQNQQQQQLHHHHHHSHPAHAEQNNNQMEEIYSPELTADENPFYYDKNKLLFDLHVQRQRRHQSHH